MHDKEEIGEYELADRVTAEIPIPYAKYSDGVFWFRLKTDENIDEKTHGAELGDETATAENPGEKKGFHMLGIEAAYYGIVDFVRKTEICIGMCTYKREDYVRQNMKAVARVLESKEEVSGHISMYVVDNGNTLKEDIMDIPVR